MTTQEVANEYYKWAKDGKWTKIHDKLYSDNAWSIESSSSQGPPVQGKDAIKQKGVKWGENIKEVHGGYCNEPIVAGNHFSCTMGTTYTDKKNEKQQLDEVCVFEVNNGKIVKEQFFY